MIRRPSFEKRRALAGPVFALILSLARASSAADVAELGMPMIRSFDTDDGLPQNSVNAIAFAPDGRLWIGTQSGAAYYDGQRFTTLRIPTAGSGSWVQAIGATQDGAVWFGLDSGDIFRHAGERFTRFGAAEGLERRGAVGTIVEAREGGGRALWVGTRAGLYRFHDEEKRVGIDVVREGQLPSGEPTLWVGTTRGLLHCEAGRCAPFTTKEDGLPHSTVAALLTTTGPGGRPELWVGTLDGLAHHADGRWEQLTKTNSPLPIGFVSKLAETVSGAGKRTLWIGTFGGGLAASPGCGTTGGRRTRRGASLSPARSTGSRRCAPGTARPRSGSARLET